jgi:type IV secretory pathway VirB10-like protein
MITHLRLHEQRQILDAIITALSQRVLDDPVSRDGQLGAGSDVAGAAALLGQFMSESKDMSDHIVKRLVQDGPTVYDDSTWSLRVIIATLASDEGNIYKI